jgi:hypothetical protein
MRLIDADKLKSLDKNDIGFALWLDHQPTAFDINKFEDNINKIADRRDFYQRLGDDSKANALQEAIEILRMD